MSDCKVVGLRGQPIIDRREPVKAVIDIAEDIAERARNGEIKGIAVAYIYSDEGTGCQLGGEVSYGTMGRLDSLKVDILNELKKW
jgi:hypothetical protein